MNLNDFYILVDNEKRIFIDKIQELPENWNNISGLNHLSEEKLKDLTWSGNKNVGWINIKSEDIKKYESKNENLELNKNEFKKLVSNLRKEKQAKSIDYCGAKIRTDLKTRYSLMILLNSNLKKVNFKCINGYFCFSIQQLKEIFDIINIHIQNYFDMEKNIYEQIDKCESIQDFMSVNYDF